MMPGRVHCAACCDQPLEAACCSRSQHLLPVDCVVWDNPSDPEAMVAAVVAAGRPVCAWHEVEPVEPYRHPVVGQRVECWVLPNPGVYRGRVISDSEIYVPGLGMLRVRRVGWRCRPRAEVPSPLRRVA